MVCTATHGVEGFTGSACLVDWLRMLRSGEESIWPAAGVRIVLVHAINPHGYAWIRRVNEDNIDLNRNFIDHTAPKGPNALYAQAHPHVRPSTEDSAGWAAADAALEEVAAANGVSDAMRTVLGGQYDQPDGIFYGGTGPAWSNELIRRIIRENCGGAERVLFLDLHTGLGPFGHAELMCNGRGAQWPARLRQIFGEACTGGESEQEPGLPKPGAGLSSAVYEELPSADVLTVTVEWGTYSSDRVLRGHRLDNWLHFGASEAEKEQRREEVAAVMKENLCPSDEDWRELVIVKSRQIMHRAVAGLLPGAEAAAARL